MKVILALLLMLPVIGFCQMDPEQIVLQREQEAKARKDERDRKAGKIPKPAKVEEASAESTDNTSLPRILNDTLYTTSGFKMAKGQNIKIGSGAMPDGDFKYIRVNAGSLFRSYSNTGYNGLANQANSFPRSQSGLNYEVKKVEARGDMKHGFVYYAKIGTGMINYEVDVENAIASGEIAVPEEFKPKQKSAVTVVEVRQPVSVADEITKLKKLLDDGVLTKEEFDSQKKKLLDKN